MTDIQSIADAFSGTPMADHGQCTVEEWAENLGGVQFDRHKDGSIVTGTAKPKEKRLPSQAALHNAARARNRWPIGYVLNETQYRDAIARAAGIRVT